MSISKQKKNIVNKIISLTETVHGVIGGAGTGKTKLIEYLVKKIQRRDPNAKILNLAFANATISICESRFMDEDKVKPKNVESRTIHSFSIYNLFKYGEGCDLKKMDKYGYKKPITIGTNRIVLKDEEILNVFKELEEKNKLVIKVSRHTVRKYHDIVSNQKSITDYCSVAEASLFKLYAQYKAKNALMDFEDMQIFFMELLKQESCIRKDIADEYDFIICDEAQDISYNAWEIIKLIKAEKTKLILVGDVLQRAYGFMGALPDVFESASESYADDLRTHKLTINRRSTLPIINLANAIADLSNVKHKAKLKALKCNTQGEKPVLVKAGGRSDEAQFIVKEIKKCREQGIPYSEISVLVRNIKGNRNLGVLKADLKQAGIGYYTKTEAERIIKLGELLVAVEDGLVICRNYDQLIHEDALVRILCFLKGVGMDKAKKITTDFAENVDIRNLEARKMLREVRQTRCCFKKSYKFLKKYDRRNGQTYRKLYKLFSELKNMLSWRRAIKEKFFLNKVYISTIHGIKGDEKECVFVMDVSNRAIPDRRSSYKEEQCLFYIAITRAKKQLYMTYSQQGNKKQKQVTRFLRHITEQNVFKEIAYKGKIEKSNFTPLVPIVCKPSKRIQKNR